jgi:predicted phosphodiesterase
MIGMKKIANEKIVVLSDIHGNYIAFQKCLEYVLSMGIRTFIFLGDYLVQYPRNILGRSRPGAFGMLKFVAK